ncbi:MAG: hypothetical protein JO069_13925 [Verrucomicrobia bacterium]|nr:hypothetical protein [Verrucomicrobiota bacterium]
MPPSLALLPGFARTFVVILGGVCEAIAARGPKAGTDLPLIIPAHVRLRRLTARFLALVEAFRAGRLAAPRSSPVTDAPPARPSRTRPVAEEATAAAPSGAPVPPKPVGLPSGFGWMLRFGSEVAGRRSQLEHWLTTEPELGPLLAAAPQQAGRILRPLCHMLGIKPPPALRLPPRPPRVRPKPAAAAPRPKRPTKAEIRSWLPGQKRPLPWSRVPAGAGPPFGRLKLKPA